MVETKGVTASVAAWKASHSRVPASYKAGVLANTNQNERAQAAEELWKARIAEAAARGARLKGLQASSTEKWKKAAAEKGAARISGGMAAAVPEFQEGITRVLSVIEGTSIPARVADPMANIDNRLKPIAQNLYDMKRK